jgi:hypothetical protein
MPVLHTIGRVCLALAGFIFVAVSPGGSSLQRSELCSAELGLCVDEIESACPIGDEVTFDAIWVEKP